MSGEKSSGWLSGGIKPIVDITASVTAVVAYLQAIFKLIKTDFPDTVSLLTIAFTSVMVVGWRWGKLNQKKKKTPSNIGSKPPAKGSIFSRLLAPLKTSKNDPYLLPLTRRRMEAGIVTALTIFTLGWTGLNISGVVAELTTDSSLICISGSGEDNLRIIVADVLETGQQELLVSDKIYEELVTNQPGNSYDVCRLFETFKVYTSALQKADELEADIVIWGRKDLIYEIHLNSPVFADPDRKISVQTSEDLTSPEFQLSEPEHIAYVAEFTLSEIMLINGRVTDAQIRLRDALNRAEKNGLNDQDLAEGYYLLGVLYDPNNSEFPDEQKAIDAYGKAVSIDKNLFAPRLNRGFLLGSMGRVDEAIAEYTYLIENNTPLKGSASINRAFLQTDPEARIKDFEAAIEFDPAEGYFFLGVEHMEQGKFEAAIQDFEAAIEYDPQFYANYHLLGLNQLYAGKYDAAKQTYIQIVPYLSEEDREPVIEELQDKAKDLPEIAPTVDEIIKSLRAAKLP